MTKLHNMNGLNNKDVLFVHTTFDVGWRGAQLITATPGLWQAEAPSQCGFVQDCSTGRGMRRIIHWLKQLPLTFLWLKHVIWPSLWKEMEKCMFIMCLEELEYMWLVLTTNTGYAITVLYCMLIIQLAFLLVKLLLICMMELSKSIIHGVPQMPWDLSSFENFWLNPCWEFQLDGKLLGAGWNPHISHNTGHLVHHSLGQSTFQTTV